MTGADSYVMKESGVEGGQVYDLPQSKDYWLK